MSRETSGYAGFRGHADAMSISGIHTTCQFNTKIFYPDGKTPYLWSSDALSNADFDPEKLSFYADGCAITLNQDATAYTIKSAVNENSIVNLTFTRTAPGFHVGRNGKSYFGTDPTNPWGSMRHAFWPRCQVEGSIITKAGDVDFKGRGLFIHALQGMKPHHAGKLARYMNRRNLLITSIAAKWNFVNFQSPRFSAVMMEFTTPPSYGSTVVSVAGIAKDDEILCAGSEGNSVEHIRTQKDSHNDWAEPTDVKFVWQGLAKDGRRVSAKVEGSLGKRLDKVDVMEKVPGFIKTLVGGVVGTKPYIYQVNTNSRSHVYLLNDCDLQYSPQQRLSLTLDIDGVETVEEGDLFSEAVFIS